jgi:hypothetical protein
MMKITLDYLTKFWRLLLLMKYIPSKFPSSKLDAGNERVRRTRTPRREAEKTRNSLEDSRGFGRIST